MYFLSSFFMTPRKMRRVQHYKEKRPLSSISNSPSSFLSFPTYPYSRASPSLTPREIEDAQTHRRGLSIVPALALLAFYTLSVPQKRGTNGLSPPSRYWAKEDGSQYEVSILHFPFLLEPRFLTESRVCLQCMLYASPVWRLCAHCGVFPRPEEKGSGGG